MDKLNRREANVAMRKEYLSTLSEAKEAQKNGDEFEASRLKQRASDIANDFVKANKALVSQAGHFLQGSNREDHEAAALLGLWEAFVGTTGLDSEDLEVDADGNVTGATGWDPESGTFATYSRRHITGRAGRSVSALDTKYQGFSYSTFQAIPGVKSAHEFLKTELSREPTAKEVADKAGVTVETVRAALAQAPRSLDAPLGAEGGSFGDLVLSNKSEELTGLDSGTTPEWGDLSIVDIAVIALRGGLTGREPLTVNETASSLGIGRGAVANAQKRFAKVEQ